MSVKQLAAPQHCSSNAVAALTTAKPPSTMMRLSIATQHHSIAAAMQ
jgi:hypothetical protein